MTGTYDDIRQELENISERMGDRIMTVLREAIEAGATGRPAEEKQLTRARTAVDKAVGILTRLDDDRPST